MSIQWRQTAWQANKTGEKKAWRWEGTRKDGRSFTVHYFAKYGYIATSFNGTRLGVSRTLADAQKLCEKVPGVVLSVKMAA